MRVQFCPAQIQDHAKWFAFVCFAVSPEDSGGEGKMRHMHNVLLPPLPAQPLWRGSGKGPNQAHAITATSTTVSSLCPGSMLVSWRLATALDDLKFLARYSRKGHKCPDLHVIK